MIRNASLLSLQRVIKFWQRVDVINGPIPLNKPELGHCWIWTTYKNKLGYGFYYSGARPGKRGETLLTHRTAYELVYGVIPGTVHLDHLCRNPSCCNPDHLDPVTCAENLRRGANAKINQEQAREVRRRAIAGVDSQRKIAKDFGISPWHVWSIYKGLHWKEA